MPVDGQVTEKATGPWWGHLSMQEGETRRWTVGGLRWWLRRLAQEWQLAYERRDGDLQTALEIALVEAPSFSLPLKSLERFVFRRTDPALYVSPVLADRAVVSRPRVPFHLHAGEEVTVYVSSPLCVRLEAGTRRDLLKELFLQRPSDTWFGPSASVGELCYASRTHCRLELAELPLRADRAVTPVVIRNRGRTSLLLEKLNLPVHYLAAYQARDGHVWTPVVTLTCEPNDSDIQMDIGRAAPVMAGMAMKVSEARVPVGRSNLIHAVTALFG